MDGTGSLFGLQQPGIAQHFDLRCLVLPTDDLTPWPELTANTLALIRQEHQGRPVYLCGESFGACLAMELISRAPHCFSGLILVNSASSFHRLPWLRWASGLTSWVAAPLYQLSTLGLLPLLANTHRLSDYSQQALLKAMQSVSQRSAAWRLSLLSQFQVEDLGLDRYQAPVVIVAGKADRLLPSVDEANRLAEYFPQAHIHILNHSGHACLLEDEVHLWKILQTAGLFNLDPATKKPG